MGAAAAPSAAAIEVRGLMRTFGRGYRAVDGVDLAVDAGEIYGFLGPNGAGKSTTVHVLTTLLSPTSGRILVGGFDVAREAPRVRRVVGAALQEVALDPALNAREHLHLQGALHGLPRRAEELLGRVGLAAAASRKVGGYSGGMRRRLDLALALVHRPSILFLDEPTTGLDVQSRTALWSEVRALAREEGTTVFLTTQYLEEADALADRVGIIDRGQLVAEGRPDDLKAEIGRPTLEVTTVPACSPSQVAAVLSRFGADVGARPGAVAVRLAGGTESVSEVLRTLNAAGFAITHLDLHAPTLDDVFLAKTGRSLEGAGERGAPRDEEDNRSTVAITTAQAAA